jgi:hypothetical protein
MIKRIKKWTDKSSNNRRRLPGFCIVACQLAWFIPITVFDVAKYGWTNPIPLQDIFMQLCLTLLSIWVGSKIAIKIIYEKN